MSTYIKYKDIIITKRDTTISWNNIQDTYVFQPEYVIRFEHSSTNRYFSTLEEAEEYIDKYIQNKDYSSKLEKIINE